MKKFGKFIVATLSLAAIAGGAFYFIKNVLNKDSNEDFDDFEDDFEDFDDAEEEENTENREYVTLNMDGSKEDKEAGETAGAAEAMGAKIANAAQDMSQGTQE